MAKNSQSRVSKYYQWQSYLDGLKTSICDVYGISDTYITGFLMRFYEKSIYVHCIKVIFLRLYLYQSLY